MRAQSALVEERDCTRRCPRHRREDARGSRFTTDRDAGIERFNRAAEKVAGAAAADVLGRSLITR